MLDWRGTRIRKRVKVDRYDRDPIRELFWCKLGDDLTTSKTERRTDIFARRVERVEVV